MKRKDIERLLPGVFRRTIREEGPLMALLEVMESLHAPAEQALEGLDAAFDPRRAPDAFVPYLAGWVDLERLFDERPGEVATAHPPITPGMGRLRELVAAAAWLSQWRGTSKGLQRFLETATGLAGFSIEEEVKDAEGSRRAFHVRVRGPAEAKPFTPLLHRIIGSEKPAYVTYELLLEKRE